MTLANELDCNGELSEVDRSHRIGLSDGQNAKPRDILVKFSTYRARQKFLTMRASLKDKGHTGVFINEDRGPRL